MKQPIQYVLLLNRDWEHFSLFNGISTFQGYQIEKPPLYKNRCIIIEPIDQVDKKIHIFNKHMNQKMNIIARLKFEHAYYDVKVQHIRHKTTRNTHEKRGLLIE